MFQSSRENKMLGQVAYPTGKGLDVRADVVRRRFTCQDFTDSGSSHLLTYLHRWHIRAGIWEILVTCVMGQKKMERGEPFNHPRIAGSRDR
jgi:hypothetical protein